MHDTKILQDIVIIIAVIIPLVLLANRLKFPSIVGFIVSGIIIGPYALGWLEDKATVEMLAELGIILLLFSIGLEFSIEKLLRLKNFLILAGGTQVGFSILIAWLATILFGASHQLGILVGFLVALSSTAIIMKILGQRKELGTPVGMLTLSIALFQDLCIIPMMLLLPILAQTEPLSWVEILSKLFLSATGIAVILVGARLGIPPLLKLVARADSRDVFIASVIFIIVAISLLASYAGLSLALGAFLAGLIISESDFAHQIVADILPMRDALTSLFFISVGMLLNIGFLVDHYAVIFLLAFLVIVFKSILIGGLSVLFNYPLRIGLAVGLIIAQIGEFSLVIAMNGHQLGLLSDFHYQVFLGSSVMTMLVSPFLISNANRIGYWAQKKLGVSGWSSTPFRKMARLVSTDKLEKMEVDTQKLKNHVVIVGYGKTGQHLSSVLRSTGIPYVIIEMLHFRYEKAKTDKQPVIFGDSANTEILHQVHVEQASVLVTTIGEVDATRRTVDKCRELNPTLHIISRIRYIDDVIKISEAGADEVIPEEFETSIEIFARTLRHYHIPRNVIASQVAVIRKERYETLLGRPVSEETLNQLPVFLAATATESCIVTEASPVIDKTLAEAGVTTRAGVQVIAVVRNQQVMKSTGSLKLQAGDVIVITGTHAEIDAAIGIMGVDLAS